VCREAELDACRATHGVDVGAAEAQAAGLLTKIEVTQVELAASDAEPKVDVELIELQLARWWEVAWSTLTLTLAQAHAREQAIDRSLSHDALLCARARDGMAVARFSRAART
jgi:hypothetical protein